MSWMHGWAESDRWRDVHFLRDGAPACGLYAEGARVRLVGTLKGRTACTRCLDELAGVTA